MKVLYIDDNQDDCDATERFLGKSGMEVICVRNALSGLDRISREKFDLIICDMLMPSEDGLLFARRVSEQGIDTPFILTSGVAALHDMGNYTGLNNYLGFIVKPVTKDKLDKLLGEKHA